MFLKNIKIEKTRGSAGRAWTLEGCWLRSGPHVPAAAAIMHDGPATDSNVVVYSSARGCKQAVRPDGRMLGELESTPEIVVAPFARLWWRPGRAPTKRCKETSGK